jgi:hypothetical protein
LILTLNADFTELDCVHVSTHADPIAVARTLLR